MSASCFSITGKISKKVDQREYGRLVGRTLPHVIDNGAENEHYIHTLEILDSIPEPTEAEKKLAELLTTLIEDFEEKSYPLKRATPVDSLAELMEAHGLKQKDLVGIFGTASIVSEVLNGKRHLTTEHIRKLSERFHVTPELFI